VVGVEESVNVYDDSDIQGLPTLGGWSSKLVFWVGFLVSALSVYELLIGNFEPALQRPLHVFLMGTLTAMVYPSRFFKPRSAKEGWFNLLVIALLFAGCLWAALEWTPLYIDPYPTNFGIGMGILAIVMVLEITRRSVGMPMVIIALCMILYCFVGPYLPDIIAHPGFSLDNVVVHIVVGTEGMMGLLLSISVNQIIFFMMFAAFLIMSNSTNLFMDLAKALAGGYAGGPAKVAIVSSGMMGMVSGSASGNVATTGAVTIPLMKQMGFAPHIAAAIEAVSSTAGQFMPPIMGASAFVIAEYMGISYWAVCVAAAFPAVTYFIGMYVVVDVQARIDGLRGFPKSQLPPLWHSFKATVPLLVPLTVLVLLLTYMYSPQWAIIWSIIVLIGVALFIPSQRMGIPKIIKGLALTAKILIPIATSCATAGIIVGVMSLTGLGNQLSYWIIAVAQGNLLYGLLFTALVSVILGMGIPTLGAYVVLATIGAPALEQLGAPLIGAHLFIFYFACLSAITPPVALAAFVGAGLAGSDPWKTGWTAVRLGIIKYIIPFMFVFRPGCVLQADLATNLFHMTEMLLLIIPVSVLTQKGYWLIKCTWWEVLLFVGAVLAIFPTELWTFPVAVGLEALGILLHVIRFRKLNGMKRPEAVTAAS
jgi:TRAP transporter 4TM/12TM fusion protein